MPDSGTYGTAYSHNFTSTGGTPIHYSITDGYLPPGLILNSSTGLLGGTPTQAGIFGPITVTATNGIGSATQRFTINIDAAAVEANAFFLPLIIR